jgi:hypothetical protein
MAAAAAPTPATIPAAIMVMMTMMLLAPFDVKDIHLSISWA